METDYISPTFTFGCESPHWKTLVICSRHVFTAAFTLPWEAEEDSGSTALADPPLLALHAPAEPSANSLLKGPLGNKL